MNAAALLPLLIGAAFALWCLIETTLLLVRRRHPRRVLVAALTLGFALLMLVLLVPPAGVVGVVWWVLLAVSAAGVGVALARADPHARRPPLASLIVTAALFLVALGVSAAAG